MMDVMIGVDPHKGSHTATMLDREEHELTRIKVRAGCRQVAELLEWATVCAADVGGGVAGGLGYLLSQQLVATGETVWTCRRRWRHGYGCSGLASRPRPIRTSPLGRRRCVTGTSAGTGPSGRSHDGVPAAGQASQ